MEDPAEIRQSLKELLVLTSRPRPKMFPSSDPGLKT